MVMVEKWCWLQGPHRGQVRGSWHTWGTEAVRAARRTEP